MSQIEMQGASSRGGGNYRAVKEKHRDSAQHVVSLMRFI